MSTGFLLNGADVDTTYVTKDYLMDQYPNLMENMKTPQLFVTGNNIYGQLGTNNTTDRSSPVTTAASGTNWKTVAGGYYHTAAIKTDGTLWTWGRNNLGQLGTNNTTDYSSPITTAAGGTNWKSVSSGYSHTAAIKTDGTLWVCGYNNFGQLGTNNTTSYSSPVTTVAGGTNWKSVACGDYYTAAIKTDGTLWVCGRNDSAQLGTNNTTSYSSPVTTAAGGTNWKTVAGGTDHTSAIKTDGTLWVWGYNNFGQLGTNNTTSYSSPVTTVAGGTNWKQVSCGNYSTAAIKTDGTLWGWGRNLFGQLGTNNTTSYSSPVTTVAGGTNWKSVSCRSFATAAIKTDGTLWVWGYNIYGQLGTNGTPIYSPVTTVAGGTNWKEISIGFTTAAISESEGW